MIRRIIMASAFALAMLPLAATSGSAAPMSTSDLLKPQSAVEQTWCKRVCHHWGHCGYGHHRYRCCKSWHRVCH